MRAEMSQQLLTSRPWYVPELIGPSIPAVEDDPEKRAMLLLILFKPWNPDLASLLEDFPTWGAALHAFETQLHAEAQDFQDDRPATFSQAYWAARSLRVMQHISNCSGKPAPVRGIRTNPDAAVGSTAGRTLEAEDCGGVAPDDEDACSELSDRMPDDDDLDAAVYQAEQDSQSSRAQSKFLPTLHFIETIVQGRSTLEFSVENDTFVQEFREIPQETDVAPNPLSQTAASQWRLPAHVCLQALLTREAEWEKLVDESVSNAFHDVAVADPSFLQRRSLLAALKARVEQTCNSASSVLYTALELIKAKTFSQKKR